MQEYNEVSKEEWDIIQHVLMNDDALQLANLVDLNVINNRFCVIQPPHPHLVSEKRKMAPLLMHAIEMNAVKCITWLLENNADPNVRRDTWTALMYACYINNHSYLLVKFGAIVHIPIESWSNISLLIKYTLCEAETCRMLSLMFSYGLELPEDRSSCIPPVCYEIYDILLAREVACRRACYAFLLDARLPRDLVRWMLTQYVLPSKRESTWSPLNVKMPKGFEILD
jgi:hypothetical protein